MAPVIDRSAFVGIDCDQRDHPDGDLCAVHFPHQGLTIRRVFMQGDTFLLKAENEKYSDLTIPAAEMDKRTVGRVIWVLQTPRRPIGEGPSNIQGPGRKHPVRPSFKGYPFG